MSAEPVIRAAFAPQVEPINAEPINAEQWQAWKLGERESDPLQLDAPATLDDAVRQAVAAGAFHHKDTLAVLYSHAGRRKQTLWLYAIKRKSAARYVWSAEQQRSLRVHDHYPELIAQTEVAAFAPVERWRWTPGADVVGLDRGLVEQRS